MYSIQFFVSASILLPNFLNLNFRRSIVDHTPSSTQRDSWLPTVFETVVATKILKKKTTLHMDATVFIKWNIKRLPRGPP